MNRNLAHQYMQGIEEEKVNLPIGIAVEAIKSFLAKYRKLSSGEIDFSSVLFRRNLEVSLLAESRAESFIDKEIRRVSEGFVSTEEEEDVIKVKTERFYVDKEIARWIRLLDDPTIKFDKIRSILEGIRMLIPDEDERCEEWSWQFNLISEFLK